jgi:preprotein translocase SecE subunit
MSLKFYKKGQGYYTRLYSGLACFLIVAIGCYSLYQKLYSPDNIWVCTLIPGGICVGLSLLIFWMVNKPNVADFMIAAEGEIKKVSWSSRQEIVASTTIVIVVVLCMGFMLVGVDFLFQGLFRVLGVYPKLPQAG